MKPQETPPASSQGGYWPNQNQTLLLQVALFQGERCINAWQQWKTTTDIEVAKLDHSSFRLLPQVYRNLYHQGVNEPLMEKLKGIYRLHWYQNQRLFHHMTPLLRSFHAAGIKTMILKGAALSLEYYRDYGLRAMEDFDVCVPNRQSLEAITLLKSLGWTPKWDLPEEYRSLRHSQPFRDSSDCELDFHWHVLSSLGDDDDFWEKAHKVSIHDVSTLALSPTDQILHVCTHGAVWGEVPHLRWVADAMVILKVAQSEIDWNRLLSQARKRHLVISLREACAYLRDKFDAPISPEILKALQNTAVSKRESLEYHYTITPPTFLRTLIKFWLINWRLTEDVGFWKRLVRFSHHRHLPYWGMQPMWKLLFYAGVRATKKLWRSITLVSKRVKHDGQ